MSIKHLTAPNSGDELLPIYISSLSINGEPFSKEINVSLSGLQITGVQVIGNQSSICGSFLFKGTTIEGTPSSVSAYQDNSGLGNKYIIVCDIGGTIYYESAALSTPLSVVTLNSVNPLPEIPIGLYVKVLNDSTGIVTVFGVIFQF